MYFILFAVMVDVFVALISFSDLLVLVIEMQQISMY